MWHKTRSSAETFVCYVPLDVKLDSHRRVDRTSYTRQFLPLAYHRPVLLRMGKSIKSWGIICVLSDNSKLFRGVQSKWLNSRGKSIREPEKSSGSCTQISDISTMVYVHSNTYLIHWLCGTARMCYHVTLFYVLSRIHHGSLFMTLPLLFVSFCIAVSSFLYTVRGKFCERSYFLLVFGAVLNCLFHCENGLC